MGNFTSIQKCSLQETGTIDASLEDHNTIVLTDVAMLVKTVLKNLNNYSDTHLKSAPLFDIYVALPEIIS